MVYSVVARKWNYVCWEMGSFFLILSSYAMQCPYLPMRGGRESKKR